MDKSKTKKIGIIGYGYVGKAFDAFFKTHYDVCIYDPYLLMGSKEEINTCDVAVICVPTPSNPDGSCNTDSVEDAVSWLQTPIILIKSTVEIGTTRRLSMKYSKNVVFSPEFAGESKYWTPQGFTTDVKQTPFFIFGSDNKHLGHELVNIYMPITGPSKTYRVTDSISAEITKYVENTYFAMKVAFVNELYDLCQRSGTHWNEVRDLWLLDPRTNKSHTAVFSNERGFGGKCLPKDTKAMVAYGDKIGIDLSILKTVLTSNDSMTKRNE
jgi:UDPglucose 6-dehydrogenase